MTRGGKDVKSCEDALGADVWTELKENIAQSLSNTLNSRRALMMGNFAAAQLDLCRAVKQDPKNAEAAQNLVRLFLQQGQAEEALVYSQALSKNQPDNLVLQDLLGDALLLSGDETAAAELWKKLYGDRSEEPMRRTLGVWLATAAQAAKANDYSKAERLYARVIVFEQQSFAAWYGITESALRLQNFARAARCAASAAHINPESAMVKLYWGDALKGQEDADGAISKWSEAFRLDRKLGKAVLRLKEAGVDYRTL